MFPACLFFTFCYLSSLILLHRYRHVRERFFTPRLLGRMAFLCLFFGSRDRRITQVAGGAPWETWSSCFSATSLCKNGQPWPQATVNSNAAHCLVHRSGCRHAAGQRHGKINVALASYNVTGIVRMDRLEDEACSSCNFGQMREHRQPRGSRYPAL